MPKQKKKKPKSKKGPEKVKARRLNAGLDIPEEDDAILVITNGCNTIILGPAWIPAKYYCSKTIINVGLPGMEGPTLSYIYGVVVAKVDNNSDILLVADHAAYNPSKSQAESLAQPNALCTSGNKVCNTPSIYGEDRCIVVGDTIILSHWMGSKLHQAVYSSQTGAHYTALHCAAV